MKSKLITFCQKVRHWFLTRVMRMEKVKVIARAEFESISLTNGGLVPCYKNMEFETKYVRKKAKK